MLGTPKCCSVQMAPHFFPVKLQFLWFLRFCRAKPTLQELACSWPQGNNMRRKDMCRNGDEWSAIFFIIFSAFFLLLFPAILLGDCTSSNSKYCLCDKCVSQGKVLPLQQLRRAALGSLPSSSTGAMPVLVSWHKGFGQWCSQKLWKASWNDKSHYYFNAFTNPELEGPKGYAKPD